MMLQSTAALATSIEIDRLTVTYYFGEDRVDQIDFSVLDLTPVPLTFKPDESSGKITVSYIDPETGVKKATKGYYLVAWKLWSERQ